MMATNPSWTATHLGQISPVKSNGMSWVQRVAKKAIKKKNFSVVDVKRAMNLIAKQGKTPSAVHIGPDSSVRTDIVLPDQTPPKVMSICHL